MSEFLISVSEARSRLAEIVERVTTTHRPVHLTLRGRRIVAVIDADDLDHLIGLAQETADALAARDARIEQRETSQPSVPWDDVRADLGLQ